MRPPACQRSALRVAPLALVALLGAGCGEDPAPAPPLFPSGLAGALDEALATEGRKAGAPGLSVRVERPDLGAWAGAWGVQSLQGRAPSTPDDRYRIGSVTKTFTAAIVLQLVAEGRVDLDDPLDAHVPGFELGDEVTVRRLLSHQSGIFNYTDDAAFLNRIGERVPPAEVIAFARAHGEVFAPGAAYGYSNTNYYLLGLLIEAVTGAPFPAELRRRLLDPLELRETWLESYEPAAGPLVDGHLNTLVVTDDIDLSWSWAAGGMASTTADLCRWAAALFRGDVLPADLRAELVQPSRDDAPERYGLGVRLTTRAGIAVAGHTGSVMGFRGELFFDLERGTCVALATNDFLSTPPAAAAAIWAVLRAFDASGSEEAP